MMIHDWDDFQMSATSADATPNGNQIKGNLDGTIVTPGDPSDSALYQVVILADDDPELMPPKGDPLTEDERTMIKRWILEGASEEPAAEAADPNAAPKPKEKTELAVATTSNNLSLLEQLSKGASAPGRTQLKAAADKSLALVTQLSERNPLIRAEFSSFVGEINDSNLSPLSSIKSNISHFDVSRTKVSDKAVDLAARLRKVKQSPRVVRNKILHPKRSHPLLHHK